MACSPGLGVGSQDRQPPCQGGLAANGWFPGQRVVDPDRRGTDRNSSRPDRTERNSRRSAPAAVPGPGGRPPAVPPSAVYFAVRSRFSCLRAVIPGGAAPIGTLPGPIAPNRTAAVSRLPPKPSESGAAGGLARRMLIDPVRASVPSKWPGISRRHAVPAKERQPCLWSF